MRDAGMAITRLPQSGERMVSEGPALELVDVAARVVALARLASAMHMSEAARLASCADPETGEDAR